MSWIDWHEFPSIPEKTARCVVNVKLFLAALVDRLGSACRSTDASSTPISAHVEAKQRPAAVRIVATQPAFAETAIERTIFGDAVVCTGNRTRVITALELGAFAAFGACAPEWSHLLCGALSARPGET